MKDKHWYSAYQRQKAERKFAEVQLRKKLLKQSKIEYTEMKKFLTEPRHIKALKIIVLLIPIIIIGYLIILNLVVSQEFNYFYDIGSEKDNYLSPVSRISEIINNTPSYRNLTGGLVYFNVPIARGSETIKVQARFKDNFPNQSKMSLGAKDQEVWHYKWNSIYNPALEDLSEFEKIDDIYRINPELDLLDFDELKNKEDIVIATDNEFAPIQNIIEGYESKETIINTTLRGGHAFYIYISGNLDLEVKKQDINWYERSDELEISLYDLNNNLIANTTIPDDGVVDTNKTIITIQSGTLRAENLDEGVYKLEFSSFDGLIREIKINTNKVVSNKLFLADNELYNVETKNSTLYTKSNMRYEIKLLTAHPAGIQNITYNNQVFEFYQEDEPLYMNLTEQEYELTFPKNDLIVSGPVYFAFSKENYFEPFKQVVIPIVNDMDYIRNNVDYLITDYKNPVEDYGWLVAETEFNIREDGLFVKEGKLSMVFNIPHLGNEEYSNYTIPVDWIKISVYKPGFLEKYNIKSLKDIPNLWRKEK